MKKVLCAVVVVMVVCSSSYGEAKVDLDLSKFSHVVAYSGLLNILASPSAYTGKVIKLTGKVDSYHDDATGNDYFGVIVNDVSECCAAGLDFVLKDASNGYPKNGAVITVSGRFETYREGEDLFCRLADAEIM